MTIASGNPQKEVVTWDGFMDPPLYARPGAFWAWLEGQVSMERITYELEEMKDNGSKDYDLN